MLMVTKEDVVVPALSAWGLSLRKRDPADEERWNIEMVEFADHQMPFNGIKRLS